MRADDTLCAKGAQVREYFPLFFTVTERESTSPCARALRQADPPPRPPRPVRPGDKVRRDAAAQYLYQYRRHKVRPARLGTGVGVGVGPVRQTGAMRNNV